VKFEEFRGGNANCVLCAPPERGYGAELLVKTNQELVKTARLRDVVDVAIPAYK
jgi:hypothetical protein